MGLEDLGHMMMQAGGEQERRFNVGEQADKELAIAALVGLANDESTEAGEIRGVEAGAARQRLVQGEPSRKRLKGEHGTSAAQEDVEEDEGDKMSSESEPEPEGFEEFLQRSFVPLHLQLLFPNLAPLHPIQQVYMMARSHHDADSSSRGDPAPKTSPPPPSFPDPPRYAAPTAVQPAPPQASSPHTFIEASEAGMFSYDYGESPAPPQVVHVPSRALPSIRIDASSSRELSQHLAHLEAQASPSGYSGPPSSITHAPSEAVGGNRGSSLAAVLPPKMSTTLISNPTRAVTQMEYMQILVDARPGTHVTDIFHFYRPGGNSKEEPLKKCARSALIRLSNYQHDLLYSLAGCIDIKFILSNVSSQARHFMEVNFGIPREQLSLWFKNRKPKGDQSRKALAEKQMQRVIAYNSGAYYPMMAPAESSGPYIYQMQPQQAHTVQQHPPQPQHQLMMTMPQQGSAPMQQVVMVEQGNMLSSLSSSLQPLPPPYLQQSYQQQQQLHQAPVPIQMPQPAQPVVVVDQHGHVVVSHASNQPPMQNNNSQEVSMLMNMLKDKLRGDPEAEAIMQLLVGQSISQGHR